MSILSLYMQLQKCNYVREKIDIRSECIRHFCVFRTMGRNYDLVTR